MMHSFVKVSASDAFKLLEYAVKEAEKMNSYVAVAVCGPEGELIAFLRMDLASPAASRIARNKAYTAACDRKSTRLLGNYMLEENRPSTFWGDPSITGFGGGLPILKDDGVIGGIGISGLSEAEDERIAAAAIRAVYGDR